MIRLSLCAILVNFMSLSLVASQPGSAVDANAATEAVTEAVAVARAKRLQEAVSKIFFEKLPRAEQERIVREILEEKAGREFSLSECGAIIASAAENPNAQIMALLLGHGFHYMDKHNGLDALGWAKIYKNEPVIKLIENYKLLERREAVLRAAQERARRALDTSAHGMPFAIGACSIQ